MRHGASRIARREQDGAEIVLRLRVSRRRFDGALVLPSRFVDPTGGEPDVSQIVVREGVSRIDSDRRLVVRRGVARPAHLLERDADVVLRDGRLRLQAKRGFEVPQRALGLPQLEVQRGGVVSHGGVLGLARDDGFAADCVFGRHLAPARRREARAVAVRPRHRLDPDVRHLVGRSPSPRHALRRMIRVPRVRVRVVEHVFHLDARAGRQPERRRVAVLILPPEIPLLDPDQPFFLARGQKRVSLRASCARGSARAAESRALRRPPAA